MSCDKEGLSSELTLNKFVQELNGKILGTLSETISVFKSTFFTNSEKKTLKEKSQSLMSMCEESIEKYFFALQKAFGAIIAVKISAVQSLEARETLNSDLEQQDIDIDMSQIDWASKTISEV